MADKKAETVAASLEPLSVLGCIFGRLSFGEVSKSESFMELTVGWLGYKNAENPKELLMTKSSLRQRSRDW